MPEYLVETYESERRSAFPQGSDDVRHVRSIYVPRDEVGLHLFAAPSPDALRAALDRAAFGFERIVEAVTDEGGEG